MPKRSAISTSESRPRTTDATSIQGWRDTSRNGVVDASCRICMNSHFDVPVRSVDSRQTKMGWEDLGVVFHARGQRSWMASHGYVPTACARHDLIRVFV